jgi:hypothetical protein
MKNLFKLTFFLSSPILAIIYWRNMMKEVENLHSHYELNYTE